MVGDRAVVLAACWPGSSLGALLGFSPRYWVFGLNGSCFTGVGACMQCKCQWFCNLSSTGC
jgi:hypothetical protein